MNIILDVSAAFAIVTGNILANEFLPLIESADQVLAPDLFYSEATNTAWKFHHIEDATPEQSLMLAERAVQLIDLFIPSDSLWKNALSLACEIEHPAYDCYYLTAAQQMNATLLTVDKRLKKIAMKLNIPLS